MKEVLTMREAAELLQFSDQTMRRMLLDSTFPAHYIRDEYRFIRNELLDWVKNQNTRAPGRKDVKDRHKKGKVE